MSDELLVLPTFFEYVPLLENDTKYSRLCSTHFTTKHKIYDIEIKYYNNEDIIKQNDTKNIIMQQLLLCSFIKNNFNEILFYDENIIQKLHSWLLGRIITICFKNVIYAFWLSEIINVTRHIYRNFINKSKQSKHSKYYKHSKQVKPSIPSIQSILYIQI